MGQKEDMMQLGLTKTEATIYMTLLEQGPCSLAQLTKHAGIHRTNAYMALESLGEKGLSASIVLNNKKTYKAADPNVLKAMIEQKLALVNQLVPQLSVNHAQTQQHADVMLYEGTDAIRSIMQDMLQMAEERVVFGVPKIASELLGSFFDEYHQKRIEQGKSLRHIYNFDAKDRREQLNQLPLTACRYLPKEYDSPVATSVCGDMVALTLWQKKPVTIVIKNPEMAASYKGYFEILWNLAKE